MQFRLSEYEIKELFVKIQEAKEYDQIPALLQNDARILVLFRLNNGLNRNDFANKLSKSVVTISNLETGIKNITTIQKAEFYSKKLEQFIELPLNFGKIFSNYRKWKNDDMEGRIKRAIENAKIGGFAAAKKLTPEQRSIRAKKGGVAAKLKHAGIHGRRHLWMQWFKEGLKVTGKRIYTGPKNEKMVNELELKVALQLFKSGIKYKYEPFLRVEDKKFYPDFKTGDNIIECCYWESEDRWLYLATKFSIYHGSGFNCILVTKRACSKYFHLIPDFVKILKEEDVHDISAFLLPYGCQPPR